MRHSWPEVELGDDDLREAPQQLAEVRRQRVEVGEVHPGHLACRRAGVRCTAASMAAHVEPQPRMQSSASSSPTISSGGMSLAMPATLAARRWTIFSWFSGV